jgi:lycopene cyclase CruP
MLEDYWRLMPQYQQVDLEDLTVQRILFGFFPTFRSSPLQPGFDRILQVGDASGIQSPLSFGGFGALMRHLPRLAQAIPEALQVRCMQAESC